MINHSIIRIAAAAGTLLLAGCAARLDPAEDGASIRFTAGSALLRDDATKATAPLSTPVHLGVFCYSQPGTVSSPGTWNTSLVPNYMFNLEVSFDGSSYTYSPARYWPPSETTLSFWAYCPRLDTPDLLVAGTSNAFTSASAGIPDIHYTTDGHTDFMVSSLVKNQSYDTNSGVVVLPFSHAMSKVDVYVNKQDPTSKYTVNLKAVSFNGIYHTGTIGWDTSLETWDWASWSGQRQNLSVWEDDPDDDSDDIVLTLENQALPAVLPLPQSLADASARLHVEFSVSYEGILHERSTTREVLLSQVFEEAGAAWHKNSHYTLNITISPDDPIEFTVNWSDWGDAYNFHITD